jgi:ATP-dependent Lhr-like helicase
VSRLNNHSATSMDFSDPLRLFLPVVQQWFQTALGEPTPAQRLGWPAIAAGQHTLILAPTGSGKTLAAFLACLDGLWRQDPLPPGVRVLYVSPLKALNNDIYRNLQLPLEGVTEVARKIGQPLPGIDVAVRTGDTPASERQRLLRRPPHVLITTPESLHLLLTSKARDALRNVTHCIVDEIHAISSNKRGVFLALLLERLARLTPRGFVRIGLSATQRPLDEVARYLGGSEPGPEGELVPRPVTIIDAGLRKDLDLRVVSPVEHFGPLPEKSVWPSIYRLLGSEIRRHRSTIVFTNNRRSVERITANLNEQAQCHFGADLEPSDSPLPARAGGESQGEGGQEPGHRVDVLAPALAPSSLPLSPQGGETGDPQPLSVLGRSEQILDIARAHHGSIALEVRQETEQALKEGRLPAVVATASLELGIDMGNVDLVCQVESPGNVARALQRVGRAGHLVGQKSKGRLIPKTPADLLELAVLTSEMAAGHVEAIQVPINCLDVLAQQVVAIVAMEPWNVPDLHALVRQSYPYSDLSPQAFDAVLEMVSGRYVLNSDAGGNPRRSLLAALQPRVSWDRTHNRLLALPGSQHIALVSGGTIPDTGQYAAYTPKGARIGELDEEFIYERRVGDTFALGTNIWRVEEIQADRVIVAAAEGAPALMPFWRGERAGRSRDLGLAIGRFLRTLAGRIHAADCRAWLENEFHLDPVAARNLHDYVRRQLDHSGCLPTDRTLVVEAARDPLGDWQVMLLSPLGSRLHLSLRLALEAKLTQRLGYRPQCLHHDDGILIRLADTDEPVLDLFSGLTPENVEQLILDQLADSALFALRFRQNAARALLMPRMQPGKRSPLWLQRLRSRDLLQVTRRHPDFPIVAETFRECLHDHLDLPSLQQLLSDIQAGSVELVTRQSEAPSPFASGLLFAFTAAFMYQYDGTEPEPGKPAALDQQLLEQLIAPKRNGHLLDSRAIHQVERRLRGLGQPPRTSAEMAEWLRRLGDLAPAVLEGPMAGFVQELEAQGRAKRIMLTGCREPERWILVEEEELYRQCFVTEGEPSKSRMAAETILGRFLDTHALVGLQNVLERYPFEPTWAQSQLEEWSRSGRVVPVPPASDLAPLQWSAPANLEQVQRGTLALLRREVVSCPPTQFADFSLRWQGLHPACRCGSADGLASVLGRLEGLPLPAGMWERTILPGRVPGYQTRWLDQAIASGEWIWMCQNSAEDGPGVLAFWRRDHLAEIAAPPLVHEGPVDVQTDRIVDCLRQRGASFVADLARDTRLPPSTIRENLWTLLRRGVVSNDHFDVIRRGRQHDGTELAADLGRRAVGRISRSMARMSRTRPVPEGRWSLLPWGLPETEARALFMARVLLGRYGIVARELALLDPWMMPWRILYEVLSRMELAGDVRRGYFAEGLSGAQFALPEAARMLQDVSLPSTASAPFVLVHSLDPANLYGSGAPFDIPLLDGGARPLVRRAGQWLVLRAGRPILIIEQQGKRLTALASASQEEVAQAVTLLPATLDADRVNGARHKITVEEWNGQPVTTTVGRDFLQAAGFVRDYQGMTLYGAWR